MDSTGPVHPSFERALARFDEVEAQYRADRERVLEDGEARQREIAKMREETRKYGEKAIPLAEARRDGLRSEAKAKKAAADQAENPWPVHRSRRRGAAAETPPPETTERTASPPRNTSWPTTAPDSSAPKRGRVSDDDYFTSNDWFSND